MDVVYTVDELREMLKVGRNAAYSLVQKEGFPKILIGKSIRIPKQGLEKWVQENINAS